MDSIAWHSRREKFLDLHFQNFREVEHRLVVDVGEPRFNLRDAAAARIEANQLKLRGKVRLRPAERVAPTAHLGANVVLVAHVEVVLALRSLWLRCLKAHARDGCRLAELQQFVSFDARQGANDLLADFSNRPQVIFRYEKPIERFAGKAKH